MIHGNHIIPVACIYIFIFDYLPMWNQLGLNNLASVLCYLCSVMEWRQKRNWRTIKPLLLETLPSQSYKFFSFNRFSNRNFTSMKSFWISNYRSGTHSSFSSPSFCLSLSLPLSFLSLGILWVPSTRESELERIVQRPPVSLCFSLNLRTILAELLTVRQCSFVGQGILIASI